MKRYCNLKAITRQEFSLSMVKRKHWVIHFSFYLPGEELLTYQFIPFIFEQRFIVHIDLYQAVYPSVFSHSSVFLISSSISLFTKRLYRSLQFVKKHSRLRCYSLYSFSVRWEQNIDPLAIGLFTENKTQIPLITIVRREQNTSPFALWLFTKSKAQSRLLYDCTRLSVNQSPLLVSLSLSWALSEAVVHLIDLSRSLLRFIGKLKLKQFI